MTDIDSKKGSLIGLTTVILTQIILRVLDIGNVSVIIGVTILATSVILIPLILLRNDKLSRKLRILGSIIMSATSILIIVMIISLEVDVNRQHKNFIIFIFALSFISFIVMTIFWGVAYIIISKKR